MTVPPRETDRPAPQATSAGLRCRRCRYDLRGLPEGGRCPECGLPLRLSIAAAGVLRRPEVEREAERWEWVHGGCWWIAQSTWAVVPFVMGAGFLPPLTVIAIAGITTHGVAHWFGSRDVVRGLHGLVFESGDPIGRAVAARRWALGYAVAGGATFLGAAGSCVANAFAGPAQLLLPACAVAVGLLAIVQSRRALVELCDAIGIRDRMPLERCGTIVIALAAALWGVALSAILLSATSPALAIAAIFAAPPAGVATLAALLFHRDLAMRVAAAIPQVEEFSPAAERVARKRERIRGVGRPARQEDLSPIRLDDAPPRTPSPGDSR